VGFGITQKYVTTQKKLGTNPLAYFVLPPITKKESYTKLRLGRVMIFGGNAVKLFSLVVDSATK
jgi:hypothetical protein